MAFASESSFSEGFNQKVEVVIVEAESVPGLKSEVLSSIRELLLKQWHALQEQAVLQIEGEDQAVRPPFVSLQAIIEHVLASSFHEEVKSVVGIIHTPMPATPLCTEGEVSPELIDPSIENDPRRLFTLKARAIILRDYLFKGGVLYCAYPKKGYNKRTEKQRAIYQQELARYANLIDCPLKIDDIPTPFIGATYFFKDKDDRIFVFSIHMTQANDPKENGQFGLWFGPLDTQ